MKIKLQNILPILLFIFININFINSQSRKSNFGFQILYSPSITNFEIINYKKITIGNDFINLYKSHGLNRMWFGYSGGFGINYRLNRFIIELNYLATKRGQQSSKNYRINWIQTYPDDYDGYNLIVEQFSKSFNLDVTYMFYKKKFEMGISSGLVYDYSNNFFQNFYTYSKKDGRNEGPSELLGYHYSYSAKRMGLDIGFLMNFRIYKFISYSTGINYKFLSKITNEPEIYMPNGVVNIIEFRNKLMLSIF